MRATSATWPIEPAATPISRVSLARVSGSSWSRACRSAPPAPPTTCASPPWALEREPSLAREGFVAEGRRLDGRQSWHSDLDEFEAGRFMTSVAGGGELAIGPRETGGVLRPERLVEILPGRLHFIHI